MGGAGGGLCLDSTSLHEMAWVMMLTAWQRLASHFHFPLTVFWKSMSLKHCMQTNRKQNLNADSKTTDTHRKTKPMVAHTFHGLPTDVFDSFEFLQRKVDKYAAKRHSPAWAVARAFFARGSPTHPHLRPSPPKAQEGEGALEWLTTKKTDVLF